MDPKLLSLIGPYSKKFNLAISAANSGGRSSPRFQSKAVPFTSSKPPSGRIGAKQPDAPTKQFEGFYKKTAAKFIQGTDSKRSDRGVEMEMRRKARRTETLMAKRNVDVEDLSAVLIEEDLSTDDSGISSQSSANKDDKVKSKILMANPKAGNVVKEVASKAAPQISDKRREQLLNWKKTKQAVVETTQAVKRPPFRPGGPPVLPQKAQTGARAALPAPAPAPVVRSNGINNNRARPIPPTSTSTTSKSTSKPVVATNGTERRVTRAMAKTQPDPLKPSSSGIKPAINKLKNLNLNGKPPITITTTTNNTQKQTSTKGNGSGNALKVQTQVAAKVEEPKKTVAKGAVSKDKNGLKQVASTQQSSAPQESIPKVKKLKAKGIDPVYTEYNAVFAKACEQLSSLSKDWTNIIHTVDNIPEDVRDDIISALGKVKLLLQSKLPQFSDLLYSYLCKEMDPRPILECDLQGWWDVANIQVEGIGKVFENLKTLKSNNWVKEVPVIQVAQKKKPKNADRESSTKTPSKPVQASKGMKEFLAMKRMAKKREEEGIEIANGEDEPKNTPAPLVPDSSQNTFEGGFFVISSPAHNELLQRRSSRRLTGIENRSLTTLKTPATPTRRGSNMGLRMLTMRQSMGSLLKIGVRPVLYSETTETSSSDELKKDVSDSSQLEDMDITEEKH